MILQISSVRLVKNMMAVHQDMITFFEGKMFSAQEYYSSIDTPSLGTLAGKISSLILTGASPWTVYT